MINWLLWRGYFGSFRRALVAVALMETGNRLLERCEDRAAAKEKV